MSHKYAEYSEIPPFSIENANDQDIVRHRYPQLGTERAETFRVLGRREYSF
jgi:hypothetical protein